MTRILLYLGTNLAVIVVIGILFGLLGIGTGVAPGGGLVYSELLLMAAIIGFSGSLISLFLSKWMAKRSMGVQLIDNPTTATERWLVDVVQRQAQQAGIGMPELGIFDHPAPNAFATGWNRNAALVAVSTGLLQHMTAEEVEAVLGHEVSHVANGDMVTLALIQGVVNTFVVFLARIIGHTVDRVIFKNEDGPGIGYFVVSIIAEICLSILASTIVMAFSRYREYRADAGGATLAGRQQMIAALRALQRVHEPDSLPAGELAAFGISGKLKDGVLALFSSHPPLEQRIAALEAAR